VANDRFARGIQTALSLFTPKDGAPSPPSFEYPEEIAQHWNEFSISTVMGDVWGRDQLDKQQRALITIGVLTALDKPAQLRQYITGGLNLGLTREQICEAILHVSVYAGFPAAIQGFQVANEVFDTVGQGDE
jgi:4-carboxymuconolactone decarboxylase